jgi:hypothetical protein
MTASLVPVFAAKLVKKHGPDAFLADGSRVARGLRIDVTRAQTTTPVIETAWSGDPADFK